MKKLIVMLATVLICGVSASAHHHHRQQYHHRSHYSGPSGVTVPINWGIDEGAFKALDCVHVDASGVRRAGPCAPTNIATARGSVLASIHASAHEVALITAKGTLIVED